MKFKVSEDIDAPQPFVFAHLTDFTTLEADLRGRGARLDRVGGWIESAEGVAWEGEVTVREKPRAVAARITSYAPHETCVVDSTIGGMQCHYELNFIALSPQVTRVAAVLDLSAKTMTARLLLQTLKLARGRVLQRLQAMLARQGNAAEAAYRAERSG